MTTATTLDPAFVNVRIKISALWVSMLLVFAYVVASRDLKQAAQSFIRS